MYEYKSEKQKCRWTYKTLYEIYLYHYKCWISNILDNPVICSVKIILKLFVGFSWKYRLNISLNNGLLSKKQKVKENFSRNKKIKIKISNIWNILEIIILNLPRFGCYLNFNVSKQVKISKFKIYYSHFECILVKLF